MLSSHQVPCTCEVPWSCMCLAPSPSTRCVLAVQSGPIFATPGAIACQAPLSMGFSKQEYWSGLPFPAPGNLLDPEIKPNPFLSPVLAGASFTTEPPGKPSSTKYQLPIHKIRAGVHHSYAPLQDATKPSKARLHNTAKYFSESDLKENFYRA